MVMCSNCGRENPVGARFCNSCATPLVSSVPHAELRKIVTVLFADVAGSTTLGERLDPESFRHVMGRYFDEMRAVIERHGGTVAKFIGDAVMAVFGVPQLHEDDALRAVRASAEIGKAVERLNEDLDRQWGVRIATRVGVNTGEVMAGGLSPAEGLVIGDAVNTAARLEQAAKPGEVLIGEQTYRFVRDAVKVELVESLSLKGKADTVPAYRLAEVWPEAPGRVRRLDSPMVGRNHELSELVQAFEEVVADRSCRLVTVVGQAGIGKSRLMAEFESGLGNRARVVGSRCLSYGEGITYWPIAQIVKEAAGITEAHSPNGAIAKIAALLPGDEQATAIAERVSALIGLGEGQVQHLEGFWGVRKLLESLAREGPLAVLIEDIHWAQPTLLDLIEYVSVRATDVPILLLCSARPELLERRAGWSSGAPAGLTISLEPLGETQSQRLIENLVGEAVLPTEVRNGITDAAEGNPLFVEEMFSMLIDDGLLRRDDGKWVVAGNISNVRAPPTINALLAARLERLSEEERQVIEAASVVGNVFYWGAVTELSPEGARPRIGGNLMTLVTKEFIRPVLTDFAAEDAFQFRHILIRDAAYREIPKSTRAELHERFADWLEQTTTDRPAEFEEMIGYHLEHAYRYRVELGPVGERGRVLAERASRWLASAGQRAIARGDVAARINLFSRAGDLLPPDDHRRPSFQLEVGFALVQAGDLQGAEAAYDQVIESARAVGARSLEWQAALKRSWLRLQTHPEATSAEDLRRLAEKAIEALAELRDEQGLGSAWEILATAHYILSQHGPRLEASERALEYAIRAGDPRLIAGCVSHISYGMLYGATPTSQAITRSNELLETFRGQRIVTMNILYPLAVSTAMRGRFDEARNLLKDAKAIAQDLGSQWAIVQITWMAGEVERVATNWVAAERQLRTTYEMLDRMGEKGQLSTVAVLLGEVLYAQGHYDDAFELTLVSEKAASPDDLLSQMVLRSLRAKVLARREAFDEAGALSQDAVRLAAQTDSVDFHAGVLVDMAEVLRLAGRTEESVGAAEEALSLYERKENVVSAEQARGLLAELTK
jgi:class 3 adenylate cyclase/tetratricopeptide (TPR) repeat protein